MCHRRAPTSQHRKVNAARPASDTHLRHRLSTSARKKPHRSSMQTSMCSNIPQAFDTGGREKGKLPTQGESVVLGPGGAETMLQERPGPPADIDYLAVSSLAYAHLHAAWLTCLMLLCAAGAYCSAAERPKGHWILWDQKYGLPASEPHRSAQLCNGFDCRWLCSVSTL